MRTGNKNHWDTATLRRTLSSMREEVAVPSSFRASLMRRLAKEHGFAHAQAGPSFLEGLGTRAASFFFRPALIPAAVAVAFALAMVIAFRSPVPVDTQTASVEKAAQVPQAKASRSLAPANAPEVRTAAAPQAPVKEEAVAKVEGKAPAAAGESRAEKKDRMLAEAKLALEQQAAQEAPRVLGMSGPAAPAPVPGIHAAHAKPTYVVVTPAPTPVQNMFSGNSQVRRNKFRASRGEDAVILVNLKNMLKLRIEVFDRMGRKVAELMNEYKGPGVVEARWAGLDNEGQVLGSGIYVVRIETALFVETHKLMLIR